MFMRGLFWILLLTTVMRGTVSAQQMKAEDVVRVREFYRLAAQIQDKIWPHWSEVPAPLLLVTQQTEFLTHYPSPPADFKKSDNDFYVRPRFFDTRLLATFPAFGPVSVIVIGEPESTSAQTSTPWLITVMHEHFHQLQDSQPGYFSGVESLGLSGDDKSGMWMLNYPFPYAKPEVADAFQRLKTLLLQAMTEPDQQKFEKLATSYAEGRNRFFLQLSPDDHKYLTFQLWQEGIARYTQIKAAEAAAEYHPSAGYAALPDFESFAHYASHARQDTLDELRRADLSKWKREVVYSWGAAEGFLLDRLNPGWRDAYFKHPYSLDSDFEK